MAASISEILSVPQLRAELRIPDGATATRAVDLTPVTGTAPLVWDAPGLRSISSVKFWTLLTGNLTKPPDGEIAPGDLGAVTQSSIQSPALGWPDTLPGSVMQFEYIIGTQDELLRTQIESAVSFIQHSLRAPMLDVVDTYHLTPATGTTAPLVFAAPALKRIENLEYWTPSGSEIDAPDGRIDGADLGRLAFGQYDWQTHALYPNSTGWPETLPGTLFELTVTRGIDITPETAALRTAVVLLCRSLYDGYREMKRNSAFFQIVRPFRARGFVARRGELSPSLASWMEWNR